MKKDNNLLTQEKTLQSTIATLFSNINILSISKVIFIFLLLTLSLFHIFFEHKTTEQKQIVSKYRSIVKERNQFQINLLTSLEKKEISTLIYSKKVREGFINYEKKLKSIVLKKNKLNNDYSFRGRSSFRLWIYLFGLVTLGLFFSCKSLYDDIIHGSTYKFQFISLTGVTISFYWAIHLLFFTQEDLNKNSYIALILFCAILCSIFTYFFVKNYTYKDDIILKQLSLIDRIKTIHYPKIALKALYAERNDKAILTTDSVKENANTFDEDVFVTLKDI